MVCGVFKISKIPKNEVGAVVAEFKLDKPTNVEKTEESDGTFTVVATFPPCADGSSPKTEKTFGGG